MQAIYIKRKDYTAFIIASSCNMLYSNPRHVHLRTEMHWFTMQLSFQLKSHKFIDNTWVIKAFSKWDLISSLSSVYAHAQATAQVLHRSSSCSFVYVVDFEIAQVFAA